MEDVISLKNITKTYSRVKALDNVTLSIRRGELFGLLGPNGSGKTTMIKVLTGQTRPDYGKATVAGIDVASNPVRVREIVGIIPEQENPPSFLTAEEYLYFVGEIRKLQGIKEKANKWFSLLDFADQRNILCKNLSRGTRQKLMFSQAFIHDPDIAFIDEPLVNLDPVSQRKVKDFLKEKAKRGCTIFFSTHTLEIAEEICSSFAIISAGRIVHKASMKDLKKTGKNLEDAFIRTLRRK
jgi:ABC-2 type transport system ATP-binding protein